MAIRSGRSNVVRGSSGITTAIRSGRYLVTVPAATPAPSKTPISDNVQDVSYRVFNSRKTQCKIQASGGSAVTLQRGSSIDLKVGTGDGKLKIVNEDPSNPLTAEGVYDVLDNPWNPVRSGRFIADTTDEIAIVQGRTDSYRIFNSTKRSVLKVKCGSRQVKLMPRCSMDLAVDAMVAVAHDYSPPGTTGHEVIGIYEYLSTQNPIRSGRFAFKYFKDSNNVVVINPAQRQTIIDLAATGSTAAWYRLFNSGENPIELFLGAATTPIASVGEDQSYDFTVPASTVVQVKSTAAAKPIRGMYEFLGP